MKNIENKSTGITLISLVVTVIVLLILAGISVSMITGNNNIILNAGKAKEQTEVANEKELIVAASIQAAKKSDFGEITQEILQNEIDNKFKEWKKAKVYEEDEEFFILVENRLYKVDNDGEVELVDSNYEFPKREFITQLSNNEYGATKAKPYEINCIEDLLDFSFCVNGITIENNEITYSNTFNNFNNKFIALVRSLNFKSGFSYENAERTDYGDVNQDGQVEDLLTELTTGKGWICIGGYGETQNTNGFYGTFEGNEMKISNLYINNVETNLQANGLFGAALNTKIRNLSLFGYIHCNSKRAGAFIGLINSSGSLSIINNCIFSGEIKNEYGEKETTGGIIGYCSNTQISECMNKGTIIGSNDGDISNGVGGTGGIIGDSYSNSEIINCINFGKITGVNKVGGISGRCAGNIKNSYNKGEVSGTSGIGGISGGICYNIEECYNEAKITGNSRVGGIEGVIYANSNRRIYKSYNNGDVQGGDSTGGIIGEIYASTGFTVEQCYNLCDIVGAKWVSGIVGGIRGKNAKIINCYNKGNISGSTISGIARWVIGSMEKTAKIISCYNTGTLISNTKMGISDDVGMIENCYYLNTCGATDSNGTAISSEDLKNLASTLDKAYTINSETGEVTISETEIQNVWTNDTQNINDGYPIFK